jgi:hypothetical protein
MDCLTTKVIAANCSVCRQHDGTVHLVGTEFYCGRHCPIHEIGPRLAIAGEPGPGVTESLERELTLA